ncbi:MAG: CAP domain-containing protein [Patescibacteria group bacterium]
MKKLRTHVRDHLLPHEGNGFKPLLFTATGVGAVVAVLLLVQALYVLQTRFVFNETGFLASVLPGVLATLTNEDREEAGVPNLVQDPALARAAQMKADDMAEKGYFAHVDPQGREPWYWFDAAGYDYTYAGENLAVNFTDSEDVAEAWMNSTTHRANIVKPQYTRVGFGIAKGEYKGNETTFVVQFFATPRATAAYQAATADVEKKPAPAPAPQEAPPALPPSPEAPRDAEEPVLVATVPASTTEEAVVLGAGVDTQPASDGAPRLAVMTEAKDGAVSFAAQAASSPTHTVIYVLAGLAALIAILLLVAIAAHVKVAYLEVAGGGLLMVMVALSLLVFNATGAGEVTLPPESLPASAIKAL